MTDTSSYVRGYNDCVDDVQDVLTAASGAVYSSGTAKMLQDIARKLDLLRLKAAGEGCTCDFGGLHYDENALCYLFGGDV